MMLLHTTSMLWTQVCGPIDEWPCFCTIFDNINIYLRNFQQRITNRHSMIHATNCAVVAIWRRRMRCSVFKLDVVEVWSPQIGRWLPAAVLIRDWTDRYRDIKYCSHLMTASRAFVLILFHSSWRATAARFKFMKFAVNKTPMQTSTRKRRCAMIQAVEVRFSISLIETCRSTLDIYLCTQSMHVDIPLFKKWLNELFCHRPSS